MHHSVSSCAVAGETAAQNLPFGLELHQRGIDEIARQRESRGQRRCGRGTSRFEPAAQDFGAPQLRDLRAAARSIASMSGEIDARRDTARGASVEPLRRHPERGRADAVASWHAGSQPASRTTSVHSATGGRATSVSSASCSSSASRTTGQDSARNLGDRRRVERANLAPLSASERSAHLHRPRAAFFERRVVEIRVGIGVEDLVRKRRRLGRVDRHRPDRRRCSNPLEQLSEAIEVHGLVQAVADRLVDQRMIGNANVADQVLPAGRLIREHRGQQVVGAHALDGRRHLLAARQSAGRPARATRSSASAP